MEEKKNSPLPLSVPPSIDGPAEENVVETISNPVTFACDATGVPPPRLTWLKNGRSIGEPCLKEAKNKLNSKGRWTAPRWNRSWVQICWNVLSWSFYHTQAFLLSLETSESLEMHIFSGGSKLQIARSQLSDSGTYTCVASNVEGKARKSYHLTIQGTSTVLTRWNSVTHS